jgi:uncharacterized protein (DUF1330 family)
MSFYTVFNVEVLDPVAYEPYKQNVPALVAKAGGKYLARRGKLTVLEGDPSVSQVVILEFPSEAAFRSWYDSAEYAPYHALRQRVARSEAYAVEGLSPPPA